MVHLSVAIGRFFEALFWAILRATGVIAVQVLGGALVIGLVFLVAWAAFRRRSAARGQGRERRQRP